MDVPNPSDHIQIKIKMPTESGTSSVLQRTNQDLMDIHVLGTFKIKMEKIGVSKNSGHVRIKIKMPNPSHEPPACSILQS